MTTAKKVYFDTLRHLIYTDVPDGSYAAVQSPFAYPCRIICFTNLTEANVVFSTDNTIAAGQIIVPAGGFKLYDLEANLDPSKDDAFVVAAGTQFYVKALDNPVSGVIYIENVYAI